MPLTKEQFFKLKNRLEELKKLLEEQQKLPKNQHKLDLEKEFASIHIELGQHHYERYQEHALNSNSELKRKYFASAESHLRIAVVNQGIENIERINSAFTKLIQLYLEAQEYESAVKWIVLCIDNLLPLSPHKNQLVPLSKLLNELLSLQHLSNKESAANNYLTKQSQNNFANANSKSSEIMAAFFKTTADVYLPPVPWCIALLRGHLTGIILNEPLKINEQQRKVTHSVNTLILNLCNFYLAAGETKNVHFWIGHFNITPDIQDEATLTFTQDLMACEILEGNLQSAYQLGINYREIIFRLQLNKIDKNVLRSLSSGAVIASPVVKVTHLQSSNGSTQTANQSKSPDATAELKPPKVTLPTLPVANASSATSLIAGGTSSHVPMKIITSFTGSFSALFDRIQKPLNDIPTVGLKAIPFPSFNLSLNMLAHLMNMDKSIEEGISIDEYKDIFKEFCADEFSGVNYLIEACTPALYIALLSLTIDAVLRLEELKNQQGLLGALYFKLAEVQYLYCSYENQAQRLSDCVENYILASEYGLFEIENIQLESENGLFEENIQLVRSKAKTAYVEEQIMICLSAIPLLNDPDLAPNQIMRELAGGSNLLVAWYINNRLANDCRPARVAFMIKTGDMPSDFHVRLAAYDAKQFDSKWLEACKLELDKISYPNSQIAVEMTQYFNFSFDKDYSFRIFFIDVMRAVISDPSFIHPCAEFLDILEYAIHNNRRDDIKRLFSIPIYALINDHLATLSKTILFCYDQSSRAKIMDTMWPMIACADLKRPDVIENKLLEHFFVALAQEANEQGLVTLYDYVAENCKKTLEKFTINSEYIEISDLYGGELYLEQIETILAEFYKNERKKERALSDLKAISTSYVCSATDSLTRGLQKPSAVILIDNLWCKLQHSAL